MTINNLNVNSLFGNMANVTFHYQYLMCYNCLYYNYTISKINTTKLSIFPHLTIQSYFMIFGGEMKNPEQICNNSFSIDDGDIYNYTIDNRSHDLNGTTQCSLYKVVDGNIKYLLPLIIMMVILCLSSMLCYGLIMMYRHRWFQRIGSRLFLYHVDIIEDLGNPQLLQSSETLSYDEDSAKSLNRKRIKSIDTFRGISVVLMIFVNYGGGKYWFIEHSSWNGLTVADLVFPWFVFIMGVTVAISLFKLRLNKKKKSKWFSLQCWLRSVKRTVILFLIGLALENPNCQLNTLRIMGPLQRLAIAYFCLFSVIFVMTIFEYLCNQTSFQHSDSQHTFLFNEISSLQYEQKCYDVRKVIPDIVISLPYIVISFGLLVTHACISLFVGYSNCPRGYLGPGGIGDLGCCPNCTGGIAGYIDRLVMSENHMYQTPTCRKIYNNSQPFDPEGILGNLTCTALCFLGFWAGNVILLNRNWLFLAKRLVIYAVICAGIGTALCKASINDGFIPINKNLWSVSFVLVNAGTGFFLLAFIFVMVDVFQVWSGVPFIFAGMNPLVIYAGHILLKTTFPVQWKVEMYEKHIYSLMMNVWGSVFWMFIGYIMYRKDLFISV